ncbi:unnamed protein product [Cuscuta campestris]|uniref:Uncharacterized protein n=1 Tax=Cuscuta campestris TaxID=132261 RepID=A0A484M2U3_9ASTE|nr:unnamed protein product [Cuscuta campestris]
MARTGKSSVVEIDESKKNLIYVSQGVGGSLPLRRWFCLNVDDVTTHRRHLDSKNKTIPIVSYASIPHFGFFYSLSMDGSIYLIGQGQSCVRVTSCPNENEGLVVWRKLPPMLHQDRNWPSGVFGVAGRIYVFGGNNGNSVPDPYAEVYDTESDQWVALPETPKEYRGRMSFRAVVPHPNGGGSSSSKNKKIVLIKFSRQDGLYAFDPEDKTQPWSCFDADFHENLEGPVAVWKHLVLCRIGNGVLRAYDYLKREFVHGNLWAPSEKVASLIDVELSTLVDLGQGRIFNVQCHPLVSDFEYFLIECFPLHFKMKNGGVAVYLGKPVCYSVSGSSMCPQVHGNFP